MSESKQEVLYAVANITFEERFERIVHEYQRLYDIAEAVTDEDMVAIVMLAIRHVEEGKDENRPRTEGPPEGEANKES